MCWSTSVTTSGGVPAEMVRDPNDAKALLDDSQSAMEALSRLIGRLQVFTEKLVDELDKREEAGDEHRERE
jgi:hypothetical protein